MILASVQRSSVPARCAQFYHRLQPRLAKARLRPYASSTRQRTGVRRSDRALHRGPQGAAAQVA
eukprot:8321397-Alexandrium_andersonii.AAC.1